MGNNWQYLAAWRALGEGMSKESERIRDVINQKLEELKDHNRFNLVLSRQEVNLLAEWYESMVSRFSRNHAALDPRIKARAIELRGLLRKEKTEQDRNTHKKH